MYDRCGLEYHDRFIGVQNLHQAPASNHLIMSTSVVFVCIILSGVKYTTEGQLGIQEYIQDTLRQNGGKEFKSTITILSLERQAPSVCGIPWMSSSSS